MLLFGDICLNSVTDPDEPFSLVEDLLGSDDLRYGNLEGCLFDEVDGYEQYYKTRWTHAGTAGAGALKRAQLDVVGLANNVTIGGPAIDSTIEILDGMRIAHTGAGRDGQAARAPAIVEMDGVRYGFLQRTSIFWPTHHKAIPSGPWTVPQDLRYSHGITVPGDVINLKGAPGVATIRPRTAYEPAYDMMFEGGGAALVHTWPDPLELDEFVEDVRARRSQVDILVTSHHWRLPGGPVARDYRVDIAHAAIDAGADLVASHGSHHMDEIEVYKGKVVFYGLGEFFFRWGDMWTPGYRGRQSPVNTKSLRLCARAEVSGKTIERVSCSFIGPRSEDDDRVELKPIDSENLKTLQAISQPFGTVLEVDDDEVVVKV